MKLIYVFTFILLFSSGCTYTTQRVDKTIPVTTNEKATDSKPARLTIFRLDQYITSAQILVYENETLIGEVAGGESLSWYTSKGTKNIHTKYATQARCFMLNFSCIFNTNSEIAEPATNIKHLPSNSLSVTVDTNFEKSFLLDESSIRKTGALIEVDKKYANEITRQSDICEDIGFGTWMSGMLALASNLDHVNDLELVLGVAGSMLLGRAGYSLCMAF